MAPRGQAQQRTQLDNVGTRTHAAEARGRRQLRWSNVAGKLREANDRGHTRTWPEASGSTAHRAELAELKGTRAKDVAGPQHRLIGPAVGDSERTETSRP